MDLCRFAKRPWAIPALRRHFSNQAITVLSASCCNGYLYLLLLNEYVPRHGRGKKERPWAVGIMEPYHWIVLPSTKRWIVIDWTKSPR